MSADKGAEAQALFKGGVESVASGSWGPFIKAAAEVYINSWINAIQPGDSCTYVANPDSIDIPGLGPNQRVHMSLGMGGELDVPDYIPCDEKGSLPGSCLYSFPAWNARIDQEELSPSWGKDFQDPSASLRDQYWYLWKKLNSAQRLSRYQHNARKCITEALGRGLTTDQRIALGAHFGGRFVGDLWKWNDDRVEGKQIKDYAAWIPLESDPESRELRRVYNRMHFNNGLNIPAVRAIAKLPRTAGLPKKSFDSLSVLDKRKAIANAFVIGAAQAEADPEKFSQTRVQLYALQNSLGWVPAGRVAAEGLNGRVPQVWTPDIEEAVDRLSGLVRKEQLSLSGSIADKVQDSWPMLVVGLSAVVGGGLYLRWRKKKRKPPLLKTIKTKIRKQLRRIAK